MQLNPAPSKLKKAKLKKAKLKKSSDALVDAVPPGA